MSELLADAVERHRRDRFLAKANAQYAALSPKEREEIQVEMAAWDGTLMDGLQDEDWEEERRARSRPNATPPLQ